DRVPWRTHCGLQLVIEGTKQEWWHRQVGIPKALPHQGRPQKAADPGSETSKKKQAARHRAQHALEEHLQEAYEEAMTVEESAADTLIDSVPPKPYNITSGIWEQVSFGDHKLELTEEMRIIGDKMIIRSAKHQMDEHQLTEQYGAWVARVEEAHILNEQIDVQEAQRCKGRASGIAHKDAFSKHDTETSSNMYFQMAEDILELDLGQLANLADQTEKYLAKASARSMTTARKSFATWAKKAWQTKAGILHRHVKPKEAPTYEIAIRPDSATAGPTITMRSKASKWETIWTDPVDTRTDIIEQLEHTRRRTRQEDLDPIDMEMLNGVLRVT
ncbi:unnamed protein product, partial [Prorocentrum cordatum]